MEEVEKSMAEQCPDFYKEKIKAPKKKNIFKGILKTILKTISSVFKSK